MWAADQALHSSRFLSRGDLTSAPREPHPRNGSQCGVHVGVTVTTGRRATMTGSWCVSSWGPCRCVKRNMTGTWCVTSWGPCRCDKRNMMGTWWVTRWGPCRCDKRNNDGYLVGQGGVHVGATVEFSLQQLRLFPTAGAVQEGWLRARVK